MRMMMPFGFFKRGLPPRISSGIDGALNILSGQTVDIPEGSVKQYTTLNIASGGTLRITGTTGAWTEIAAWEAVINGQIIARAGYDGQTTHTGGTFTKASALGFGDLSHTISQVAGGAGGRGGNNLSTGGNGGPGGAQNGGNGGGGGGGGGNSIGGAGGHGNANGVRGPGATNNGGIANYTKTNGQNGLYDAGDNDQSGGHGGGGGGGPGGRVSLTPASGGGGGGYRGHHGKCLLFATDTISGSGSIVVSGRNGFNGGHTWQGGTPLTAGGGGGGGAGGSGGKVVLRYKEGTPPNVVVGGGTGGAGGSGAKASTYIGINGSAGSTGTAGVADIAPLA